MGFTMIIIIAIFSFKSVFDVLVNVIMQKF